MKSGNVVRAVLVAAALGAGAADAASITSIRGWADTGGYGDNKLEQGTVGSWSGGYGLCNADEGRRCGSPDHAIDNNGGDHDMLEITFSSAVVLDAFRIGWYYQDSDATVLAYTGTGSYDLTNKSWGQLISDGWVAVGDYFDAGTGNGWTLTGTDLAASQWLIGAYNPLFGAPDFNQPVASYSGKHKSWGQPKDKADAFKLDDLRWSEPPELPPEEPPVEVPEPGTLALFGLGLLGLAGARRRLRS